MKVLLKLYPRLNLGDDLFLKVICDRYPHVTFYLSAGDEYNMLSGIKNLKTFKTDYDKSFFAKINRLLLRKLFPKKYSERLIDIFLKANGRVLKEVDAFVSIGGSIFMETFSSTEIDPNVIYYKAIEKGIDRKPMLFIGCNFGPYNSSEYFEYFESLFRVSEDVCFRETYSFDLFKHLENVRCASDVVFGMDLTESTVIENTVGFSIVSPRGSTESESYYSKYAQIIESYQERGFEISLFSFCASEGDETAIGKVLELVKSRYNIKLILYEGDIDNFLSLYSKQSIMYCGRFHAMILSMLYGQKIQPIVYSDKMTNVLKDIEYRGTVIHIEDFYKLDVVKTIESIEKNSYDIINQRISASNQFLALDKVLRGTR